MPYREVTRQVKRGFFERVFSLSPLVATKDVIALEYFSTPIVKPFNPPPATPVHRQRPVAPASTIRRESETPKKSDDDTFVEILTTIGLLNLGEVPTYTKQSDTFVSGGGGDFGGGGASASWSDDSCSRSDSFSYDSGSSSSDSSSCSGSSD